MIGVPMSGPGSSPSDVETAQVDIRRLSGTLKDAGGTALAGITVYVYQRDNDEFVTSAVTAANGAWSLSVNYTPSGYYLVWIVPTLAVTTGVMVGPLFTS